MNYCNFPIYLIKFCFILLICNNFIFAQNIADEDPDWRSDSAALHQKIDSIFQNLNYAKQTSNYLFDRIPGAISGFEFLNGKNDSIINVDSWLQSYFELKHFAEITPSVFPSFIVLQNGIDSANSNNIIPFGIININYNRIKEDAFSSGMLYVQNEQLYENFTLPDSPYEYKKIFLAAPLNNDPIHSPVVFRFDSSMYFSHGQDTILHFEIDFGDGNGNRIVYFGDQIIINYFNMDSVFITTKAILNQDTIKGRSLVYIDNINNTQNKVSGIPPTGCICDKIDGETYFNPDANWPIFVNGIQKGRAYIMFGAENTSGKLRKPFIFVDGIDFNSNAPVQKPWHEDFEKRYGDRGWKEYLQGSAYDGNGKPKDDPNINKVSTLMKKLCSEEYDMVMLDLVDGADDIPSNAMALARLIQMVNDDLVQNSSKNQIVVLGASMGGQVSRYALRFMERSPGTFGPHNTRLFISLDSPNRGANIPLGTQYAINFATFRVGTQKLMPQLFRPAPKQMLLYHYVPSKELTHEALPYQDHINLYYNDPNMTTFPTQPRLVAITNGSGFGLPQEYPNPYPPNAKTIDIVTSTIYRAWAVPNGAQGKQTIFFGQYTSLIFSGLFGTLLAVVTTRITQMAGTLPYDNTSGGYRNTNQDFAEGLIFAWFGNIFNYAAEHKSHSFIPTYSAMGISLDDIFQHNISQPMSAVLGTASYPVFNSPKSPFHAIYAPMSPDANYEHITVNDENVGWIMNEISPPDLYLQNKDLYSNNPVNGYGYEARHDIIMGYNVTNSEQPGDFIAENNSTVNVRAGNEIHLVGGPGNNGVWFKKGSNVHLFIQPFQCDAVCRMANTNDDDGSDKNKEENYLASVSKGGPDFSSGEIKKTEISKPTNIFPNPFNDHLHIDYSVQNESPVNISVYNLTGQKMEYLVSTNQHQAGNYTTTFDARKLSTGVYYIRILANEKSETVKVVKMK